MISTIDCRGGAASIAWELRKQLKADGHKVDMFVRYKYSDESDVHVIKRYFWQDWLVKLFANDLIFGGSIRHTKEYKEADIIHCHNLHSNFFNLKELIPMSKEKKVVWTLHDMWAFTGFAYNSVTHLNPNPKRFMLYLWDRTHTLLMKKKKIYEKCNLHIVTVSDWLRLQAERSILKKFNIQTIYNGVDTNIFKPLNKVECRKEFGIPLDKTVVGFGIKGWKDSEWLVNKDIRDRYFVAIGHDLIKTDNPNYKSLPKTNSREQLAKYLNCLDTFYHPTDEEAFGLISVEAMACGVHVVSNQVDAMPEILEYQGRDKVLRVFNVKKMYEEYLELYSELVR